MSFFSNLLVNLVVVMAGFRTIKVINPTQKVAGNSHSLFTVINTATCLDFFEIGSFLHVVRHVLRNTIVFVSISVLLFRNHQLLVHKSVNDIAFVLL